MGKVEEYRAQLRSLRDWRAFLLAESGLPGPRANLELVQAAADEGDRALFISFLLPPEQTPAGTPLEFLTVCGIVGLGACAARGEMELLPLLKEWAADPRWRVREAVAMALQRVGDHDPALLLEEMEAWAGGDPLTQRAAVAALCEPRLLGRRETAEAVLNLLDKVTAGLQAAEDRKTEEFRVLRQALGYAWSVAAVAALERGRLYLEKWARCDDRDVQWIIRENLKKNRLRRLNLGWVGN